MALETCSSSMYKPSEEEVAELEKLMSDGKRNYICSQPQLALDCFVELCEKLAKCYGQESDKCVEAYLYYGKTLLDIARIENGVLGHAIKEAPVFGTETDPEEDEGNEKDVNTEDDEEITPENKEDIRTNVEQAMRGENLYIESTDDDQTEEEGTDVESDVTKDEKDENKKSGDVEKEQVKPEKEEKDVAATLEDQEMKKATTTENTSEVGQMEVDDGIDCDGSEDGGEENDVSNMELAWEMLELTALICKRQLSEGAEEKPVKTTLAEAKHGLAQISLEAERYEDSVTDFKECLTIYEEILEDKSDRLIAEAHYNIALALSFDKKYSEAVVEFESAVNILKARVADLELKVKGSEEEGGKDKAPAELEEWKKEINELNDLIVLDMMAKIEDAHESKRLLDESIKAVKAEATELFSTLSSKKSGFDDGFDAPLTTDTQVVHDISNKIRSVKRKSDDEATDGSEKKLKQTTGIAAEDNMSSESTKENILI